MLETIDLQALKLKVVNTSQSMHFWFLNLSRIYVIT